MKLKTFYEVRHCGRSKKFDKLEDAARHGDALRKLGYVVTLNMITVSAFNSITTQIYKI